MLDLERMGDDMMTIMASCVCMFFGMDTSKKQGGQGGAFIHSSMCHREFLHATAIHARSRYQTWVQEPPKDRLRTAQQPKHRLKLRKDPQIPSVVILDFRQIQLYWLIDQTLMCPILSISCPDLNWGHDHQSPKLWWRNCFGQLLLWQDFAKLLL